MKIYKDELKTDDDEARIVISCTAREAREIGISLAINSNQSIEAMDGNNSPQLIAFDRAHIQIDEVMAKQIFEQVGY